MADACFARGSLAVWKASRGSGGKTTQLGTLALTEMADLRTVVAVLGRSGLQSKRVHKEMAKGWQAPGALAAEPHTYT